MMQEVELIKHAALTDMIEAIAILSGYDQPLIKSFPDGSMPDVLRTDSRCNALFLGDAKHTETPGCAETQKRLKCYMKWFKLITMCRSGSLFVLCFDNINYCSGWNQTLTQLALQENLTDFNTGSLVICNEMAFVWLDFGGRLLSMPKVVGKIDLFHA